MKQWQKGTIASGTGQLTTTTSGASWGITTSYGQTTRWGNENATPRTTTDDLPWPFRGYTAGEMASMMWASFQNSSVGRNGGAALQIAFGVLDVVVGAGMTLG